jgi:hypothetical protein
MADYIVIPFVEIEIRLGTMLKNKFDSSIDKKYFEKIKETLESGEWESVTNKNTVEYCKNSLKFVTDVSTKNSESLLFLKEKVFVKDYQMSFSPFDVRYCISQEFKLNSQKSSFSKTDTVLRNKSRKSFTHADFRYDLTIVNENIDGIIKTKHEIEIELLVNKNTLTWTDNYITDFLECKIFDLINIVEPVEREKINLKVNETLNIKS